MSRRLRSRVSLLDRALKGLNAFAAVGALLLAGTLSAQQRPPVATTRVDSVRALDLPDHVADEVVASFNDPERIHFGGAAYIPADSVLRGDVAVLEGPLELAGRVEGDVLVVNGDARLTAGAAITGDLLVVGGEISGEEAATVRGELRVYPERLHFRREGARIHRVPVTSEAQERWGRSDFLITTGKSYNRVEGMPITFGPRIELTGSNPLRVHALAVYRTESGLTLDPERMGYYVRAEQFVGGHRTLRLGATLHSLVDPVEDWHLSDLESGLATFLLHRDFRDHFERTGGSVFVDWLPAAAPLLLGLEARWERHSSVSSGSPWTLFGNDEEWRPQPLIAEGDLGILALKGSLDTRSREPDPSTGWYVQGRVERSFQTSLLRPQAFAQVPEGGPIVLDPRAYGAFTTGFLDLRRYNRVDPRSRLNFRVLLGGSLTGAPLPPQRQHTLGGEGSLPGYRLFRLDCGARAVPVHRTLSEASEDGTAAFFPNYGCDAFSLLQVEYRGKLAFRLRWDAAPWDDDEEDGWGIGWDVAPDWSLFVDAGRGWAFDARPDEALAVDVGLGLLVDRFGLFVAQPLAGGQGLNVFIRLGPRF